MKVSPMQTVKNMFFAATVTACALSISPAQCIAAHVPVAMTLPDFTEVAETCMPCVVSIKAQRLTKKNKASEEDVWDEGSDDLMQEDLLRRFFGLPPSQNKPEKRGTPIAQGSGFLISPDGYILTNNHVIEDFSEITVTFNNDGTEYPAKRVGGDPNTDIALLKIDIANAPYLRFGDSDALKIGEWVAAIGSPLGLQGSFTVGVVSAKGRTDLDIIPIEEFIQTDTTMNAGNSGGPLVNIKGEVVGMNAAIATSGGGSIGIGFTIPTKILIRVKEELLKNGEIVRGYLGVMLQKVDSDLSKLFGLSKPEGVLLTDVVKNGPADKAGVLSEDLVLKVNNQPVDSPATFRNIISLLRPGESAALTIRRGHDEIEITVIVGTHPEYEATANEVQTNLGILVQELTPELADQLGYKDEKGVVIKYVAPNSVAHLAGLKRGQLIISVNRTPVHSPSEFYSLAREHAADSQLFLLVKEGPASRFVILKLQ